MKYTIFFLFIILFSNTESLTISLNKFIKQEISFDNNFFFCIEKNIYKMNNDWLYILDKLFFNKSNI